MFINQKTKNTTNCNLDMHSNRTRQAGKSFDLGNKEDGSKIYRNNVINIDVNRLTKPTVFNYLHSNNGIGTTTSNDVHVLCNIKDLTEHNIVDPSSQALIKKIQEKRRKYSEQPGLKHQSLIKYNDNALEKSKIYNLLDNAEASASIVPDSKNEITDMNDSQLLNEKDPSKTKETLGIFNSELRYGENFKIKESQKRYQELVINSRRRANSVISKLQMYVKSSTENDVSVNPYNLSNHGPKIARKRLSMYPEYSKKVVRPRSPINGSMSISKICDRADKLRENKPQKGITKEYDRKNSLELSDYKGSNLMSPSLENKNFATASTDVSKVQDYSPIVTPEKRRTSRRNFSYSSTSKVKGNKRASFMLKNTLIDSNNIVRGLYRVKSSSKSFDIKSEASLRESTESKLLSFDNYSPVKRHEKDYHYGETPIQGRIKTEGDETKELTFSTRQRALTQNTPTYSKINDSHKYLCPSLDQISYFDLEAKRNKILMESFNKNWRDLKRCIDEGKSKEASFIRFSTPQSPLLPRSRANTFQLAPKKPLFPGVSVTPGPGKYKTHLDGKNTAFSFTREKKIDLMRGLPLIEECNKMMGFKRHTNHTNKMRKNQISKFP